MLRVALCYRRLVLSISFAATGLRYDVLLLHADSDAANSFGDLVCRTLTDLSQPPYTVFHYTGDDMRYGQGIQQTIGLVVTTGWSKKTRPLYIFPNI